MVLVSLSDMQMGDTIALLLYHIFFLPFPSLPISPSHLFLLCLSPLSDKRCLLAIYPGGSPDRRTNKALYFPPVWWVCQGPRGSEITLGGGGRGGGRGGGNAISSVGYTRENKGTRRHTHKQTAGMSTRRDEIHSAARIHAHAFELSNSRPMR